MRKQNYRRELLKEKLQAQKLVVVPVQHSGHYFNLLIERRFGVERRTVEYSKIETPLEGKVQQHQ